MIDNFKQIRMLLSYKEKEDFYFIQLFKRRKDNPGLATSEKLIKSYSVFSLQEYDTLEEHIKALCNLHNARAYIRLNKRNSKHIALRMASDIIDKVACNQTNSLYKVYDSIVGQYHQDEFKKWLIDVDGDSILAFRVIDFINNLNTYDETITLFKAMIPTLNGFHIITRPFDVRAFKVEFPTIDIHKDNPTILYFNNITNN